MADLQNKKKPTIIGPSSRKNIGKQPIMNYDFFFQMQRGNHLVLHHALAALSDFRLNPNDKAVMEVHETGFAISVHHGPVVDTRSGTEDTTDEDVRAFLRLDSTYLGKFECNKPVMKMVSLRKMYLTITAAPEDSTVTLYAVHDSKLLTMEFDKTVLGRLPGRPFIFDLDDIDSKFEAFPDVVHEIEAVIPSSLLSDNIISQMLKYKVRNRPKYAAVEVQPATCKISTSCSELQTKAAKRKVLLRWPFWESLERATLLADECSLFLVTDPPESIMLLFKLSEEDDGAHFKKGDFTSHKKLSCLVFLRSLDWR